MSLQTHLPLHYCSSRHWILPYQCSMTADIHISITASQSCRLLPWPPPNSPCYVLPSRCDSAQIESVSYISFRTLCCAGRRDEKRNKCLTMYFRRSSSLSPWNRLRSFSTPALASLTSFSDTVKACSSWWSCQPFVLVEESTAKTHLYK